VVRCAMMKLDRKAFSVSKLHEASDDAYWHARSPAERLRAVQLNRMIAYGEAAACGRVKRVISIATARPR
jgi:hypothetical protein